jgi:hypothetical protein
MIFSNYIKLWLPHMYYSGTCSTHQGTREMCRIVQDVRTCLIRHTKGPGKWNQTEIFNVVQRRIYIFKSFLLIDHSKEANCICTLTLTGTDGLCCSTIFSYIVAVSFIGGENLSTRRKPPTCCKSLTNFII